MGRVPSAQRQLGTFRFLPLDSVVWYRVYSSSQGATKMSTLSIGQVARKAGVGVETVRFTVGAAHGRSEILAMLSPSL